jgi:hypothetical protein
MVAGRADERGPRVTKTRKTMARSFAVAAVLVVALALSAAFGGCGCAEETIESPTTNIDQAKDVAAKMAILAVSTGVKAYVAVNQQAPPDASQGTLGGFVSPWPANPFTKAPLKAGDGPGDYVYKNLGGSSYELSVRLSDGSLSPAP